jgi:PAS domain S-box-containing protein
MKRQAPCEFCLIKEAIRTGKTRRVELTAPDGKSYELTSTPFKDIDGETKVIEFVRDITERKRSEEEYKNLIDGMNDTAFVIDFEGKFIDVNNRAIEVLGYTRKELLDMGPTDIDVTLKPKEIKNLIEGMKKDEKQVFETAHRNKSGKTIPVEVSSSLITYHGKPSILSIARDITERKKAEDTLRESEERFQTVIENIPHGVCLHDLDGRILLANKANYGLTGYTQEELLNMNVEDIDPEIRRREDREKFWLKLEKGGSARIESIFYHKNGSSFPVEIYISAISFKGSPMILAMAHDTTKQKEAQEKLRESEERFQTVIENLPDEIFVHGLDGKFIVVNKASCEKTGYTKEELLGMEVGDIDHESVSRDDRSNIWLKLQKKGGFDRIETTHYRKDGSKYPAEICFGIVTFKGSPMILGIAHDITERKKAIEKLKESEERFQTIIENLPHAVSLHDLDGNFVLVNEALCEQTGYTRDEYMKMKVEDVDRLSQTRDDRKKIWLKLSKGGHTHFESELSRKDVSRYPVEIYINAITLEGNPMILAIAQDISDRKKALESLQKSEEKYRNLYDSMIEAFSRSDMEGNIIEFNKHYLDMLGYNEDEIKKLKYTDLTPKKWKEIEAEIVKEQVIKRGYSDVYEKEYIKKDGTVFPVELRVFLLKDDAGIPNGMWTIVRDITERKKSEEELRKIERLESLGILAGGIAHDFNNLLTGILGNLSLVQMTEGEDFHNILEEAKQASIQAKNLTQQLLTFSKGGEPIKGKVSIEDIIRDSAEFSLHGSNVRCEFDFAEDLWKVEVDKGQMSQVIDNLVINSNQAMPEGGKIHIQAENTILQKENLLYLPEGKYVKITLQDEGIGVPEEYLSKIFDPYFSTKQEGSGLGLATVYSIIQRHEGYITVQSKVGEGTTFFIYLPAIEEKISEKGEKKAIRRTLKGEGRILIMDDEKIVRRAVGGMLGRLGYTVEFAENGEEAVFKYKEAKNSGKLFNAVILDLTVPGGMGGKKTIEELLKIDPNVKAIVSSGYSNDPIMAYYKKHGFKAVVAKPFDLKELNEAIKKVLE